MRIRGFLALICFLSLTLAVTTNAQTRASRRSAQPRPSAPSNEAPPIPRIISTTGDEPETAPVAQPKPTPTPETARRPQPLRMEDVVVEQNEQRRSLNRLAGNLEVLVTKIGFLEAQQRQTFDLQRLMYAEQRADNLRKQLLETQTKEIELQTRLEQVEFELRPDVIDRTAGMSGSTRPEEMRDLRRKTLENEKKRLLSQLEILRNNRVRLEVVVPQADAEVDRLREKLDEDARELREKFKDADKPQTPPKPKPKPAPSPETTTEPPR